MSYNPDDAAIELCDCGEAGDEYDNKEGHLQWCAVFFGRDKLKQAYNAGLEAEGATTMTDNDELRRFKADLKRTRDALVVCRDDPRLAENVNQRELDHARALQSAAEQSADDWRASYDAQVRNTLAFEEESQRLRERVKELEAERAWYRSAVAIIAQGVCASAPDKPLSAGLDESYCGGSCFVCIARTALTDTENETGEKE